MKFSTGQEEEFKREALNSSVLIFFSKPIMRISPFQNTRYSFRNRYLCDFSVSLFWVWQLASCLLCLNTAWNHSSRVLQWCYNSARLYTAKLLQFTESLHITIYPFKESLGIHGQSFSLPHMFYASMQN